MTWFDHMEALARANGCRLTQTPKGIWYLVTATRRWDLGPTPTTSGGYLAWARIFRKAGLI
jgi:hypothetical protein